MRATPWYTAATLAAVLAATTSCTTPHRAQQAVEQIDNGNAAACTTERSTIEKAVEAYTLLNPDKPVTEAALVTDGYIREQSQLMDITATGAVVPAATSVCN
ncbi:MAG TPA: hypothetical protein VH761_12595 [Ilumatobacteraceae bacterium]|jgi:hypothetical protein